MRWRSITSRSNQTAGVRTARSRESLSAWAGRAIHPVGIHRGVDRALVDEAQPARVTSSGRGGSGRFRRVTGRQHTTCVSRPPLVFGPTEWDLPPGKVDMFEDLMQHTRVLAIVGDILKVRAKNVGFGDLAVVENWDGEQSLARDST